MKKILHVDMDGVLADFDGAIKSLCHELINLNFENRSDKVDQVVEANPTLFETLEPIEGAIQAVNDLYFMYDIYFLSTPMWNVPDSFKGKRLWIKKHFDERFNKRLILTHRKDLVYGDYLVDDRLKNGAAEFKGEHIHFGTEQFKNWDLTYNYLLSKWFLDR